MKTSIKILLMAVSSTLLSTYSIAQTASTIISYANNKVEEKMADLELYNIKAARRNIEKQYEKMEVAQQNVDIKMMLSLTHPDYKAYLPNGEIWDYKKIEMYWTGGLKHVVSTEQLENNIKSFSVNGDTATALINQVWNRKQVMVGKVREVSTAVNQTETWLHTPQGWKRWKIEHIDNTTAYVDGKPVDILKPYDPDAPPYDPAKDQKR